MFDGVYFPLNIYPIKCMEKIASYIDLNIEDAHTDYSCCAVNSTYLHCHVQNSSFQYVAMRVHPCANPPSIDLIITVDNDRNVYSNISQNSSIYVTEDNIEIQISLWHYNYSMDVQVHLDMRPL